MSTRRKQRLGRGLDALLGDATAPAAHDEGQGAPEQVRELAVDALQRGRYQPRARMNKEALAELAQSVKAQGVIQPLVVRPVGGGYEIIAGERRWRAAQQAGLATVPVLIRKIPDKAAVAVSLIENIQREDLNPLEEARALKRLIGEFKLTHEQTATAVGRSRAAVTNQLRLLALSATARRLLESGVLNAGHARALLPLSAARQDQAARRIEQKGLTVRATERLVRQLLRGGGTGGGGGSGSGATADPDIARLQGELSEKLQAPVQIRHNAKKGRLIIEYHSLEELDGILKRIV